MNLLSSINWNSFLIVLGILAVLAIVFTILILVVSKVCAVYEDPKIAEVSENLLGANCGGCGFAGCADFAKALVEGKADLSLCSATSKDNKQKIATLLGAEVKETEPMMAVVKCVGDNSVTEKKFDYIGINTCSAKNYVQNGDKVCSYSCLGEGDCELVCAFNAIAKADGVAKVKKENCTACGMCVKGCPKGIIELIPQRANVYVACSSKCKGKDVMSACKVGCIGCGLCAKVCPHGAITMSDNLAIIDYSKCTGCKTCVSKCPRKIIKEI